MGLGKLAATATAYRLATAAAADDSLSSTASSSAEGRRRPLLNEPGGSNYGAIHRSSSPEALRWTVAENGVSAPTVDEIDVEGLLEDHGLFIGSYDHLVRLWAFVPLSTVLALALLAPIPALFRTPAPPAPFPFSELLIGAALWTLAHQLRPPLYAALASVAAPLPAHILAALAALTHAALRSALRVAGVVALRITGAASVDNAAFARVWAFALGCAAADAIAGTAQGYAQLALYSDVLVARTDARALVAAWLRGRSASKARAHARDASSTSPAGAELRRPLRVVRQNSAAGARLELERELDALVAFKAREELEELYGMHVVHIPVFVVCLLRVASLFLLLGFTLILAAAYLASPLAPLALPHTASVAPFWAIFAAACVLHAALAQVHAPPLLARVGVHVAAYAALLVGLGAFFAGLAMWDGLS
ncbi:hypothetical protein K488DRAFT_73667 [Vararia minispora EC-137]|uniref:Uncharacterized protein n=1 Tax=Vararia minispora EC-137 TaxID=1314806 RepID=A0ACB8Q9R6_9AGAM|nr:hypothetical protein K488DRAFT_73667 [Vararia minispora EC-137]